MTFIDIENASRDELVALAKAQHETIASMAKRQAVQDKLVEVLEDCLAAYTRCPQAVHDTGRLEEWRAAIDAAKAGA